MTFVVCFSSIRELRLLRHVNSAYVLGKVVTIAATLCLYLSLPALSEQEITSAAETKAAADKGSHRD